MAALITINLFDRVSTDTNQTSPIQQIQDADGFAIQHIWTAGAGSRAGIITLEVAVAKRADEAQFDVLDSWTIDNTARSRTINVAAANYSFVRVRYTALSGTGGLLTTLISTK